jgi:hypothetical protein
MILLGFHSLRPNPSCQEFLLVRINPMPLTAIETREKLEGIKSKLHDHFLEPEVCRMRPPSMTKLGDKGP